MNTTTRLYVVASLVVLLAGLTYVVPQWLKPKEIRLPQRNIRELPMQFGPWQGTAVKMDPRIAVRLDADMAIDRRYGHPAKQPVSVHVAVFRDLDAGVLHSPFNCYRSTGWEEIDTTRSTLQVADNLTIPVSLSTWQRKGERVVVMYWYQVGDHILFDRWGLWLGVRWKMRGKRTWPALTKVLLQTAATDPTDPSDAIANLEDIARHAYRWLNQPVSQSMVGTQKK